MRRPSRLPVAFAMIVALALLGAVFLASLGIEALEGRSEFQFFADSSTYHELARGELDHVDSAADMIGIAGNFLGPFVLLRTAGNDYYGVMVMNAVLLLVAVMTMARTLGMSAPHYLLLLLINPITVSSVLSVNKEILSLVCLAFLVRAFAVRSIPVFLLASALSVLVRWQLTLVVLLMALMLSQANPLRERRATSIVVLLAILSAVYVALAPVLEPIRLVFEIAADEYEGSGIYESLVNLQDLGLYILVFPIKAAHLLFGMGLRLDRLVDPQNIYNDVWQLLHSTSLLLLFVALWWRGRLTLRNDLVYLSVIYTVIFALTPIYTPRYFYPVFVLWAAALCTPDPISRIFPGLGPKRRRRARAAMPRTVAPDPFAPTP